jgi:hypothetical protein
MFHKPVSGIILGIALLVVALLLCLDVTAALEERLLGETEQTFIAADSVFAMFLLGLALGVPAGILLFFCYMVYRERRRAQDLAAEDMDIVLDSLNAKSDFFVSASDQFAEADQPEEPIETFDPWEKPADWWKHAGGDA